MRQLRAYVTRLTIPILALLVLPRCFGAYASNVLFQRQPSNSRFANLVYAQIGDEWVGLLVGATVDSPKDRRVNSPDVTIAAGSRQALPAAGCQTLWKDRPRLCI